MRGALCGVCVVLMVCCLCVCVFTLLVFRGGRKSLSGVFCWEEEGVLRCGIMNVLRCEDIGLQKYAARSLHARACSCASCLVLLYNYAFRGLPKMNMRWDLTPPQAHRCTSRSCLCIIVIITIIYCTCCIFKPNRCFLGWVFCFLFRDTTQIQRPGRDGQRPGRHKTYS